MRKGIAFMFVCLLCVAFYHMGREDGVKYTRDEYVHIIDEMNFDKQLLFTAYVERTRELVNEIDSINGVYKPTE